MDAKAISRKGEELTKAAASNESKDVLLRMIRELATGVKADENVLRSTKIGVIVNKLNGHADPEVARAAKDLVGKWRNEVKGTRGTASTSAKKVALDARDKKDGSATPVSADKDVQDDDAEYLKTPLDKRTIDTDKVEKAPYTEPARNGCFKLMYDGLAFMSKEPPSRIRPLALAIESAAWKTLCPNSAATQDYKVKMRSLFQNLKSKTSRHLANGILSQPPSIAPEEFVKMTSDDMKSAERKAEDEKLRKEILHDALVPEEIKSVSKEVACRKCKQMQVSYTTAQTRSADEPMTVFYSCNVCGAHWKG